MRELLIIIIFFLISIIRYPDMYGQITRYRYWTKNVVQLAF